MPARATVLPPSTASLLRVLTAATFVVILNETIMVTALPVLMASLHVDARAVQWLSTGFMLTMAVVIPTTGWFLQRVGRRAAFMAAMTSFSLGTLIAAVAPSFEVLLLGRVVQATGTAVMMPLLMSSVLALAPVEHRGRVMGNVSLAISVAPAMGPTVSGLILGVASWRWLFGAVLPVAVAIGVVGAWLLHPRRLVVEEEGQETSAHGSVDPLSVVLTVIGFGGLVYGLTGIGGEGGAAGGTALLGLPVVAAVVGVVGVVAFVWRQVRLQRTGTPLLDLRVLTHRTYAVSVTIMALAFMGLMGAMILLPLYFQDVRGMRTVESGLMLMPGGLLMGLLGPTVGRLYDRVGAARLVLPGSVVLASGMGALAWATTHAPWWVFLLVHVAMSVALAFVFTPVFTLGLGVLPAHLYPHGSALLGTVQQVAAAAGTALSVAVLSARTSALQRAGEDPVAALGGGVGAALLVSTGLACVVVLLAATVGRLRTAPVEAAAAA